MMLLSLLRRILPELQVMPNLLRSLFRQAIEFAKMMPDLLKEVDSLSTPQIIFKVHEAMKEMKRVPSPVFY